jgi:hypothetical protein
LAAVCLFTPLFSHRQELADEVAALPASFPVGVAALRSTLALATMAAAGRVTHDDVVRLITDGLPLEFVVGLLDKTEAPHVAAASASEGDGPEMPAAAIEQGFWIANIASDYAMAPDEFLQVVVARRHVLGITDLDGIKSEARPGDWLCFHIAARGIVGRARIKAVGASVTGASGIRDAHRYHQLVEVERLELHLERPVAADAETQLRLRSALTGQHRPVHSLVRISEESFTGLTAPRLAVRSSSNALQN